MDKMSKWIVKYRNMILAVAIVLLIPSAIGYFNTNINYDLLSYLPSTSESMKTQKILGDDFNLSSVDFLVVNNKTDQEAAKIKEEINKIDGVEKCIWRDDVLDISVPKQAIPESIQDMLYSGDSTMMIVTFKEPTSSMRTMNAISKIKKYTQDDCYLGGMSAISEDTKDQTEHDTPIYAGIAVVLCMIVLFLGLESTIAPVVFMLGMIFPIVYNFGTNVFLGEISYITKALAVVLQLAVTLDYSIFFHRPLPSNLCPHLIRCTSFSGMLFGIQKARHLPASKSVQSGNLFPAALHRIPTTCRIRTACSLSLFCHSLFI